MRYGPSCGSDVYPTGLESDTSGLGPQAPEALDGATKSFLAIKFSSMSVRASLPPDCQKVVVPTGEALDGSAGTFPAFKSGSLSMGVYPLVSPMDIPVSSNQPALVRQVELRQEVTSTDGMGPVLADAPPEGADPGLCTALVVGPGLCMVDGPDSFDSSPTVVNGYLWGSGFGFKGVCVLFFGGGCVGREDSPFSSGDIEEWGSHLPV
jgi:hypothetical protein